MMPATPDLSQILPSEKRIAGPFSLYNNSFTIEYLQPDPARNASVLMHATYNASHPDTHLGKKYAQTPPLHLHFSQAESFAVLGGRVGTTQGWECRDHSWTAKDGVQTIEKWTVHSFWPVPPEEYPETAEEAKVDGQLLVWAHPILPGLRGQGVHPPSMDHLFFQSLIGYGSDMRDGKEKFDLSLLMLMQHESESAGVMMPTWKILGPLRWWLPWRMQSLLAAFARWQGKTAVLEKYVGKENFDAWNKVQKPKMS